MVVCTVVLCFMLTLGLCTAFSGEGILKVFSFSKSGGEEVFAVVVGGYDDITLARASADLIKNRGGAGYIIKDDKIEIAYAVYPDEDSAKSVSSRLEQDGVYIKRISVNLSKLKWAKGELKTATESALRYYDIAFKSLYETANLLSDGSISVDDAKTKIRVLSSQIEDIKSDYYQNTADETDEHVTEVKLALITSLALLQNVESDKGAAIYASSMRYALIQLVFCRQALMNNI